MMVLVSAGFVPAHAPPPVRVIVAVKLPLVVVGVNVASAGLAFCVHVPRPAPPVHVAEVYVPVAEAPVIAMGARGVASQRVMLLPASTVGV